MALTCVSGAKECNGCMACEGQPLKTDYFGDPIYEGDGYYEIDGDIIFEDNLCEYCERFKQYAT